MLAQRDRSTGVRPVERIVQPATTDEIGGVDGFTIDHRWSDPVGSELIRFAELFEEAFAIDPEQGEVKIDATADTLIEEQLIVRLIIVVHLVLIGVWIECSVGVEYRGIDTGPRLVGDLLASESDEAQGPGLSHPSSLQEVALQIRGGAIHIPIAGDGR